MFYILVQSWKLPRYGWASCLRTHTLIRSAAGCCKRQCCSEGNKPLAARCRCHPQVRSIYNPLLGNPGSTPVPLRPRMMPTATTWPIVPRYRTSVAVKPAGSPVLRPESFPCSLSPGLASLLALGVRPKRPAARKMVVDATTIRLFAEPMKPSARTTSFVRLEERGRAAFAAIGRA